MVASSKLHIQLLILLIQLGNAMVKLTQQFLPHIQSVAQALKTIIDAGVKINITPAQ